ncbi:MAG: hypothetical protein NTV58_18720 [Deltaproteobacteria bacterium]|nr:hypothetical protein [Deltaproteobacteria bacterium]
MAQVIIDLRLAFHGIRIKMTVNSTMKIMTNQEKERYYFERFRRVYPLPEGQVKHGDKPDVIIEGQRKIGIEVTNLYLKDGKLPDSEQNQSKIREHVIQEAQRKFVEQGGNPFEISFSFNSNSVLRSR